MQGINIAEMGHVVNIIPPVDITGGKSADIFSMKNYGHATIIIQIGVSAAAALKILLNECSDFSGSDRTAIPHKIYKEESAAGDTLSAAVAAAAAGETPSANDNIFYVIELDARELSDARQFVELEITNASANSVIASAVAILSGSRYGGDQSATAIV